MTTATPALVVTRADCIVKWGSEIRPLLNERELEWLASQPAEDIGNGVICRVAATSHIAPGFQTRSLVQVEVVRPEGREVGELTVKAWLERTLLRLRRRTSWVGFQAVIGEPLRKWNPPGF